MLNKTEQQWIKRLQRTLDACPETLKDRAASYTIGDPYIVIFDEGKYIDTGTDICIDVETCNAELATVNFPFQVWSTAG